MGVARAQTQGCLCVSNPRDPRRGRQRSDHQPPDGGGEGLRGQLLGQHQEGQAVGGPSQPRPVPTGALGHRHSWEPCEVGGRDGKTGGGGQAWRGQERARGGDRGPGSDPTPGTLPSRRPRVPPSSPHPGASQTPLSASSPRAHLQSQGPQGAFPTKPLCPSPQPPFRKVREEKERARFGAPGQSRERPCPWACRGGSGPSVMLPGRLPPSLPPVSCQRDGRDQGPGPGRHGVRGGLPWSHSPGHLQEMRAKPAVPGL